MHRPAAAWHWLIGTMSQPLWLLALLILPPRARSSFHLLEPADYEKHFSALPTVGGVSGPAAFGWAKEQVPFVDLPASEADLATAYYYRTKVLREHILETGYPDAPWVVSECKFATTAINGTKFATTAPNGTVGCAWGDAFGVINAASGHHIAEGSWLRSSKYMDSYLSYFFHGAHTSTGSKAKTTGTRTYTSWQVTAALQKLKVDGNLSFVASLLPAFVSDFQGYVKGHRLDRCPAGACDCSGANVDPAKPGSDWWATCPDTGKPACWWTDDGWDAMEGSISGTGCRPSINAIVYGEAAAIAELATLVAAAPASSLPRDANGTLIINSSSATAIASKFTEVAEDIRKLYLELLWNEKIEHFAVFKTNTSDHDGRGREALSSEHGSFDRPVAPTVGSTHPPTDPRATKWTCGSPFISYWGYQDIHQNGNCSSNHWACDSLADVKELFALSSPWYFGLVPRTDTPKYAASWKLLLDETRGYAAKWGLRTAALDASAACSAWDQGNSSSWNATGPIVSCSCYNHTHGECSWDGPVWPYETARVLSGLANLLQPEEQYSDAQRAASGLTPSDFQAILTTYAMSMTRGDVAGVRSPPYVGENLHPDEGYWIARQQMFWGGQRNENSPAWGDAPTAETPDRERSVDYMHSTFIDNVLGGLLGLRGQTNSSLVVSPLVNATRMTHFAVDNLLFHGHEVAVSYDPSGSKYAPKGGGKACTGLCVYVGGKLVARSATLGRPLRVDLPEPPLGDSIRLKNDGFEWLRGRYVSVAIGNTSCDATKFGAVGDGTTDDTKAIQKALDHCGGLAGGGRVVLPAPRTYLVVSLAIRHSHTELHIPEGATLLGSDDFALWQAAGKQASAIIVAAQQHGDAPLEHVAITGGGTVDGQGVAFWLGESMACKPHSQCDFFRPHTIDFKGVTHGLLSDTLYTNSPNHVLELGCSDCELSHVKVLNLPVDVTLANGTCPLKKVESHDKDGCWQTASNTDSCDVHGSPFYIHSVNFTSGDDNVAVHANHTLVEDSYFGSGHGASIGSCGEGTYLTNITFRNITFEALPRGSGQNGCRIKTDGGVKHAHISDVTYEDLTMKGVGFTAMVTQDYNSKASSSFLIEKVIFRDIVSTSAGHKFVIGANESDDTQVEISGSPRQTPVVILECNTELAHHVNCLGFVLDNVVHKDPISGANMSCAGVFGSSTEVLGIGPSCLHPEPPALKADDEDALSVGPDDGAAVCPSGRLGSPAAATAEQPAG